MEPRRWQREALAEWRKEGRGVASVVTGAGKTTFALLVYKEARKTTDDLRLVVVVPTVALLDQWFVAIRSELELSSDEIGLFSGESKQTTPRRINIVVINTARKIARRLTSDQPSLFVVDECHRAGSPENARALAVEALYTLGLSATPRREFDDGFERFVEPALGPVIYEYDYSAARADHLIPDIALHNFHFALLDSEQERYDQLTRRIAVAWDESEDPGADLKLKRLLLQRAAVSIQSKRRVPAAVAVTRRFEDRGLVFHERIAQADSIGRHLDRLGERVAVYHSGLSPELRRRNLELFRVGQVRKLVTCRALDEGINVPDARVAVIAASTRSTRQRIQRLGRVLRTAEGKREATVCTLFATEPERGALMREAESLQEVASVRWYEVRG